MPKCFYYPPPPRICVKWVPYLSNWRFHLETVHILGPNGFIFGLFALRFQWLWPKSWFSLWFRSFPHFNPVKIVISPSKFWLLVKKWILAKMLCFVAFGHKHGRQKKKPFWAQKLHRFRVKTPIWQMAPVSRAHTPPPPQNTTLANPSLRGEVPVIPKDNDHCPIVNLLCVVNILWRSIFGTAGSDRKTFNLAHPRDCPENSRKIV